MTIATVPANVSQFTDIGVSPGSKFLGTGCAPLIPQAIMAIALR